MMLLLEYRLVYPPMSQGYFADYLLLKDPPAGQGSKYSLHLSTALAAEVKYGWRYMNLHL